MWFDRSQMSSGSAALVIQANQVSVVGMDHRPQQTPRVLFWAHYPILNNNILATLKQIKQKHQLHQLNCMTVLNQDEYDIVITQAPDIADHELASALRWQLQEFTAIPLQNAAIEICPIPWIRNSTDQKAVYAVIAPNQLLKNRIELLTRAGIHLNIVDIPEMAIRNIATLLPESIHGIAVLWLNQHDGMLLLVKAGLLMLVRKLAFGLEDMSKTPETTNFEPLLVELQRSLTYVESHYTDVVLRHLALFPIVSDVTPLVNFLKSNTDLQIRMIDLSQCLTMEAGLHPHQWNQFIVPLGAALRQDIPSHATTH